MRTFLSCLTSLALLSPMIAAARSAPVSLQSSLQSLRDTKEGAAAGRNSRSLERNSRAQMQKTHARYRRPSALFRSFNTYANEKHHFTIGYPGDWKVLEAYMGTVVSFVSPKTDPEDNVTENINILVESANQAQALHQATEKAMQQLKMLEGFKVHALEKNAILASRPAVSLVYSAGKGEQTLKFKQIWTIHRNALTIFTFAASPATYKEYGKAFEKMLGTLSLD